MYLRDLTPRSQPSLTRRQTSIGDQVLLKYPKKSVSGSNFNYPVKDTTLSFGDIIALAADFYYRWQVGDCMPSISDDWDSDPTRSLAVAAENVNLLRTDSPGILSCVRPLINQQGAEIREANSRGQDMAQVCSHAMHGYLTGKLTTTPRLTKRLRTSTTINTSDVA